MVVQQTAYGTRYKVHGVSAAVIVPATLVYGKWHAAQGTTYGLRLPAFLLLCLFNPRHNNQIKSARTTIICYGLWSRAYSVPASTASSIHEVTADVDGGLRMDGDGGWIMIETKFATHRICIVPASQQPTRYSDPRITSGAMWIMVP